MAVSTSIRFTVDLPAQAIHFVDLAHGISLEGIIFGSTEFGSSQEFDLTLRIQ
jgi:hypothetical protein